MCVARTAALQGGVEKQKVNGSRDVVQQSVHYVQESKESHARNIIGQTKTDPRQVQNRPIVKNKPTSAENGKVYPGIWTTLASPKKGKAVC